MRQYAIDHVEINWLGVDLKPGLAQGTSIVEARNATTWSMKPTGQGRAVRVHNPDRTGTLSVTVDQESEQHQQLRTIALSDRISRASVGILTVKDTTSGETFTYLNAFIFTEPDESRGTDSATFTWVFGFENLEHTISTNQNIVGA